MIHQILAKGIVVFLLQHIHPVHLLLKTTVVIALQHLPFSQLYPLPVQHSLILHHAQVLFSFNRRAYAELIIDHLYSVLELEDLLRTAFWV